MDLTPSGLRTWARAPEGKKLVRYSMVSVVSVITYEILLFVTLGLLHWETARSANILAVAVSAVPSYYLNRVWVWGKSGRSHFMKEVVPFWAMALLGLVFSTWATDFANSFADDVTTVHLLQTFIVMAAGLGAFGLLWVAKFVVLNKVLFAHKPESLPPALDGRTGLPT
ncbi:MAG: GtrA family protein [Acidimicrobiia bacterium]|nr:GtrA family protein [Acidimicrobiia bacterium]